MMTSNLMDLNYVAIAVAGVAVFVFAAVYYTVLARPYAEVSPAAAAAAEGRPPAWLLALELVKALVVAAVVAALVALIGIVNVASAVILGLVLWIAFPVILLVGSVTHEGTPPKLAAIHAGDWFAKLLIVAVIASAWR